MRLLELRRSNRAITFPYMADKITKGARLEGIIPPDGEVTPYAIQKFVNTRKLA